MAHVEFGVLHPMNAKFFFLENFGGGDKGRFGKTCKGRPAFKGQMEVEDSQPMSGLEGFQEKGR